MTIKIEVNHQQHDFLYPDSGYIQNVVLSILQGKDYPIIHLPGYYPSNIVDIGANVGATAIYFHNAFPDAAIFCYEPSPYNFQYLSENIKPFPKIKAFQYGLFNCNCKLPLYTGTSETVKNSLSKSIDTQENFEYVNLVDVAVELKKRNINEISILKIDTEGSEFIILERILNTLKKIDILYFKYFSEEDRRDIDFLLRDDFLLFYINAHKIHCGRGIYLGRHIVQLYPELEMSKIPRPQNSQVFLSLKSASHLNPYQEHFTIKKYKHSFSIIIPNYNGETTIQKTIQSVCESLDYFYNNYFQPHTVYSEIIIVDDFSNDRSCDVIETEIRLSRHNIKLVCHQRNRRAGGARNTGVKHSVGDLLFFCDNDDFFLPEHIYLCFMQLNFYENKAEWYQRQPFLKIMRQDQTLHICWIDEPIQFIRTGILFKDYIHPYWKQGVESCAAINFCVKRSCHEFIEGFLEDIPFAEDVCYAHCLSKFFRGANIPLDTVEYTRRKGNSLDRQLQKFQSLPGSFEEMMPQDERVKLSYIKAMCEKKIEYLTHKLQLQ